MESADEKWDPNPLQSQCLSSAIHVDLSEELVTNFGAVAKQRFLQIFQNNIFVLL